MSDTANDIARIKIALDTEDRRIQALEGALTKTLSLAQGLIGHVQPDYASDVKKPLDRVTAQVSLRLGISPDQKDRLAQYIETCVQAEDISELQRILGRQTNRARTLDGYFEVVYNLKHDIVERLTPTALPGIIADAVTKDPKEMGMLLGALPREWLPDCAATLGKIVNSAEHISALQSFCAPGKMSRDSRARIIEAGLSAAAASEQVDAARQFAHWVSSEPAIDGWPSLQETGILDHIYDEALAAHASPEMLDCLRSATATPFRPEAYSGTRTNAGMDAPMNG